MHEFANFARRFLRILFVLSLTLKFIKTDNCPVADKFSVKQQFPKSEKEVDMSHKMQPQATSHILMIRPVRFAFNEQTAESNAFQSVEMAAKTLEAAQQESLEEFDHRVSLLTAAGVVVS